MSMITQLERYSGISDTTLAGVVDSEATYEIVNDVLIIRTSTHDIIHITKEIGEKLVCIIENELLR